MQCSAHNRPVQKNGWYAFLHNQAYGVLFVLAGLLLSSVIYQRSTIPAGLEAHAQSSSGGYEPADGQAYFGFTYRSWDSSDPAYGDQRAFSDRYQDAIAVELGAKSPSLFGIPTIWQNPNGSMVPFTDTLSTINKFHGVSSEGVPLITWNAQTGWDASGASYSGMTTQTVSSGSLDVYIHQYAKDVQAYSQPVFIRPICGEVNGSWWKNCSPKANPNLTAQDFVAAWQHVVDIFRQEGVNNVAWVWNMNTFPNSATAWGIDTNIVSYYPGDTYVDWVGADHYDYGNLSSATDTPFPVSNYLDPHYNFALAHNKPFFLAEWAIRHSGSMLTPGHQQQWLSSMFDYVESHSKIKAVVYFDYNMNGPAQENNAHMADHIWLYNHSVNYHPNINNNDHRLLAESGASFRNTFAIRISSTRYVSQLTFNTQNPGDTTPPTVTVTNPSNNASISGSVIITVSAQDASGIAKVEIAVDGKIIAAPTTTPYTASWNTTGYAHNSSHTITATAYDTAGNIGQSSPVAVKVLDKTAPYVSITSPVDNSTVAHKTTISITATASDVSGIGKVEFYIDGSLKCTDTATPYTCSWKVPVAKGASYTLKGKAYDVANNTATNTVKVTAK